MKANRRFLIIVLGLASACMPAGVFGADDLAGLLEQTRPGAKGIITEPSIFRERQLTRLPLSAGQAEFLIDHLRVSLALAHLYAPFLDKYRIEVRSNAVIHIDDPGRLAGDADLIDARPGRRVYLIAGYFNVFKMRFNGHMVLMTVYAERQEGESVSVDATTKAYIRLDSAVGSAFARLADYLFPGKVDERIDRFLRAAERIADAVQKDPAGAYGRLASAGEVSEEELKDFGRTFLRDPDDLRRQEARKRSKDHAARGKVQTGGSPGGRRRQAVAVRSFFLQEPIPCTGQDLISVCAALPARDPSLATAPASRTASSPPSPPPPRSS